jgi:hypothetical protein
MSVPYFLLLIATGSFVGIGFKPEEIITHEQYEITPTQESEMDTSDSLSDQTTDSQLPQTGDELAWTIYKNQSFGYTLSCPKTLTANELSSANCQEAECNLLRENLEIVKLNSLLISTFRSNLELDFDYDRGLNQSDYKEPRRIIIDGEMYYLIVSNEGNIEMLVKEYKFIDDILWVKNEHKVNSEKGNYYISFDNGSIPEEDLYELEATFETFEF